MDINAPVIIGSFQTTAPEILAVVAGLLSVWFLKKEKVIAYPLGILNVLIYVYIFFISKLYANAAINGYFFFMSAYGWYNWMRKVNDIAVVRISRCSYFELFCNIFAIGVLYLLIHMFLIRFTESSAPHLDSITTAIYMVAQWLISRKKIENWILWIGADTVMMVLCFSEGLTFTAVQYGVFTIIAVLAFFEWKSKLTA